MSKKESKQSYSNKSILYIALMRHKKGLLLVILIAMISSSLAWFYKSLSVGVKIQGQVDSWNVSMGDSVIYNFGFDVLKPGVEQIPNHDPENRKNVIQVKNDGASAAYLSLEVRNIYLFGEKLVKEGDVNEDGTPNTNIQYKVQMKRDEGKTEDGHTIYTSVHYEILGFPWEVKIDFPNLVLASGTTSDLDFTLKWRFNGSRKQVTIPGDTSGATQPECLSRIIDPNVLNYVSNQKSAYDSIGIDVDANDLIPQPEESEAIDDTQYNITTCDIIDTYYGEQSVKFKEEKSSEGIINIDEFYYRRSTDPEDVKRPKQDLFIEMSLTVTQAGTQDLDINNGGSTESEPVTTP